MLKILPARLIGPLGSRLIFVFLDDGSTASLIDKNLTHDLGLKGSKLNVSLSTLGGNLLDFECEKLNIKVNGTFGDVQVENVITVDDLKSRLPTQTISASFIESLGKTTRWLNLKPYHNAQVDLLIGQDNWKLIATRELIEISNPSVGILRSALGWVIQGLTTAKTKHRRKIYSVRKNQGAGGKGRRCVARKSDKDYALDDLMREYFEIESVGIYDQREQKSEHERTIEILKNTTRRVKNGWETGLLWKNDFSPNVNSFDTARKRLFSLERKLDNDPEYAKIFYREIQRFIDLGYAKEVDVSVVRSRSFYLPVFGVVNENKPGRIRPVHDAAAKTAGVSLNDQLEAGPDLLQYLPGVLLRFRQFAYGIKGDISDMFLRIKIREEDRGSQRFLWRGADRDVNPRIYEMTCLIFGAKSSPCSANYVKNENARGFADAKPHASQSIIRNSYMDDQLDSTKTEQQAIALIKDVIAINSQANFEMHGWASNSKNVLKTVSRAEQNSGREMRLCDKNGGKVLGLYWDTGSDDLKFNCGLEKIPAEILNGVVKPKKREFLRFSMSVFDPLGLLAPFTVTSKMIMKKIWQSGIHWDDEIRDEEQADFMVWLGKLAKVAECRIPRCVTPISDQDASAQLHVFCDASLAAFAAVAYLRFETNTGQIYVSLLIAKNRIAKLKPARDIPQLELEAALMGARLADFTGKELDIPISERIFWSDSSIVLHWLKSEPKTRKVFVANRLRDIAELSKPSEWRWVPTNLNPADDATRFVNDAFRENSHWLNGPQFLFSPESEWPAGKNLSLEEKLRADALHSRKIFACKASLTESSPLSSGVFTIYTRLSGWIGIKVAARRARMYFLRWKARVNRDVLKPKNESDTGNENEQYWYRIIQTDCFGREVRNLRSKKAIEKGSVLTPLNPFLDDNGVLRADGRVKSSFDGKFENQPIILHARHWAARFLIADYHRRFYHGSTETVLNELRQKYFIVGLRTALRSIAQRCLVCRIERGKPLNPLMAALPAGRTNCGQRPFSHCGIDYFGPMFVKIGRRREKRWGILFTCLSTRAIYIDLAYTLSTSSAIMAIQRFASDRATPLIMYSDNGTNFRGASRELIEAVKKLDKQEFENFAYKNHISWRFNPPDAPHMGGAWERMIRSVKTAMNIILKDQAPCEEVLRTVLKEIQHSVNSRPLTHVSLDPRDKEALTPNHFLFGSSSGEVRLSPYDEKISCTREQYRLAQVYADRFWKRWIREYLPTLIVRKKWTEKQPALQIGDIVLVVDLQAQRNHWRRGEVVRVFPAKDEQVRRVEIKTRTGTFTRPAHKLIKLLGSNEVQNE